MVMRFLPFVVLLVGPARSDEVVDCVAIKKVKTCRKTDGCAFDKQSKSCMLKEDLPCMNFDWPKFCNKVERCNWSEVTNKCEEAASVACEDVKWPAACRATNGCGYNQLEETCTQLGSLSCEQMHGHACEEFPGRCYFFKKSRTCVTLPTVDASKYAIGGHLPNTCPAGYHVVTDVTECRASAVAMNKGWFSTISALYTGVTGICTLIRDSPRNPAVNEFLYFGSIGKTRGLAQLHHKMVCVETPDPTSTPTSIPTSFPTATPSMTPTIVPSATPTGVPTPVPTACEDTFGGCVALASQGACQPTHLLYTDEMHTDCAKSCGTCAGMTPVPSMTPTGVPTATPTTIPTAVPTSCEDTLPGLCKSMALIGSCNHPDDAIKEDMLANCQLSCNTCPDAVPTQIPTAVPTSIPTGVPTATPTELPCMDTLPVMCPQMTNRCSASDPEEQEEMDQNCPLTCGVCTVDRRLADYEVQDMDFAKSTSLEHDVQGASEEQLRRRLKDLHGQEPRVEEFW